jgi:hypothetical protein
MEEARMSRIFLASTLATLLCASLAAQATQAPPSQPTQRVAPPSAGGDPAGDPQSQARSSTAKADTVIVEGCIQRGTAGATAGTTGTTGTTPSAFMLTSAMKPASSKETAPVASSYRLDAADSKLSPHVGHKVEISGTVDQPSASSAPSASAAPTLKVDNVKMIAATCTP